MGRLRDIQQQVQAVSTGKPAPLRGPDAHVKSIVDAIERIHLTQSEGRDYSDSVQALGAAVADALTAHGDALVKAFAGFAIEAPTVNVEAPQVTVEAPQVEVKAEFELPETGEVTYYVNRDKRGLIESLTIRPNQPTETALNVEME